MQKNHILKKLMLSALALSVLVIISACTANEDVNMIIFDGEPDNDSIVEAEDLIVINENLAQDIETGANPLTGNNWLWIETTKNGLDIRPIKKEAFMIKFNANMNVSISTDHNSYFGDYQINDEELSFVSLANDGNMVNNKDQEVDFIDSLREVGLYSVSSDGQSLNLYLNNGNDVMRFEKTDLKLLLMRSVY